MPRVAREQTQNHLTRREKEKWKGDPGHHLRVFDTPHGRIDKRVDVYDNDVEIVSTV